MRIYQIIMSGGEWEDSWEYVQVSYFNPLIAKKKLSELERNLEMEKEQDEICVNCTEAKMLRKACFKQDSESDNVSCENKIRLYDIYDINGYRIEQYEVE